MRIGFVSDAHGNPLGLQACLDYLQKRAGVDRIYFLGDAVGYLPAYNEVVDLLEQANVTCVLGNHDAMLLDRLPIDPARDEIYRIKLNRPNLGSRHYDWISQWPEQLVIDIDNRKLLLVHGSPWESLTEYVYPDSDLSRFQDLNYDAVFLGHTHRPFVCSVGSTLVANVGSCGLPRDAGGLAACAIYDSVQNQARVVRIPLDTGEICSRFRRQIHDSVRDCFNRIPQSEIVGEIIE